MNIHDMFCFVLKSHEVAFAILICGLKILPGPYAAGSPALGFTSQLATSSSVSGADPPARTKPSVCVEMSRWWYGQQ